MGFFSRLFGGGGDTTALQEALRDGAIVLDVRSLAEYASGHMPGSHNIAVQELGRRITEVRKWNRPVVLCCRSGARSAQAMTILQAADVACINGGSWQQVQAAGAVQD